MPVIVPDKLPAYDVLQDENLFVMTVTRAIHQDIRPLRIVILNIMPLKIETEIHLLRLLANTPLQIEIELIHTQSYKSTNTSEAHLSTFYKTFDDIKNNKYDGLIVTGAPVEHFEFEDVAYWNELKSILDWAQTNVTSTLHICWAAQAALYHYYGIQKYVLPKKMFGVFWHKTNTQKHAITLGFNDDFLAPHSRYTGLHREDFEGINELEIVSESKEAGIYIVVNKNGREVYVTGHSEYDPMTLKNEYIRDKNKGLDIDIPENYFPNDNPENQPLVNWRSHANLLFVNWINYYVYQKTPYDLYGGKQRPLD